MPSLTPCFTDREDADQRGQSSRGQKVKRRHKIIAQVFVPSGTALPVLRPFGICEFMFLLPLIILDGEATVLREKLIFSEIHVQ